MEASKKVSFSTVAKKIFLEVLPESCIQKGEWTGKSNVCWIAIALEDEFYAYYIVQRTHAVRITGELGISKGLNDPAFFGPFYSRVENSIRVPRIGYRERIGWFTEKKDVWWPCSQDPEEMKSDIRKVVDLLVKYAPLFFEDAKIQIYKYLEQNKA